MIIVIAGIFVGIYAIQESENLDDTLDESLSSVSSDDGKQFTIQLQDGITTESQP